MNRGFQAVVAGIALMAAAPPDPTQIEPAKIKAYISEKQTIWPGPDMVLTDWERDLKVALRAATPDAAADQLSTKYGLAPAPMRRLVHLWLETTINRYDFEAGTPAFDTLSNRFVALLAETDRAPLVLRASAAALGGIAICKGNAFDQLIDGAKDKASDAWTIATTTGCDRDYAKAIAIDRTHAIPALIAIGENGSLASRGTWPLYTLLLRPENLARIDAPDRLRATARINRTYLTTLLGLGLRDKALAQYDSLDEETRAAVLADDSARLLHSEGRALYLEEDRFTDLARIQIAAALALAGRSKEADAVFARIHDVADARRRLRCAEDAEFAKTGCKDRIDADLSVLYLDHYLHDPTADPYPIAELLIGVESSSARTGAIAEIKCRVLDLPQYRPTCADERSVLVTKASLTPETYDKEEYDAGIAAIEAAQLPGWNEQLAAARTELTRIIRANGGDPQSEPESWHRETVIAEPPPFKVADLPPEFRGGGSATSWPKGAAPLPRGFDPVRFERAGNRAVAISVSQNLDPTGEVSAGGYWVHLSDDGGKSWHPPLYTGLDEAFPYVIAPASKLPLLDGDALRIEVAIGEIDTATITYPPVGTRTRRKQPNLYLEVPIAELARDSDGDGITDLAAHHLLLDQPPGARPFIVGSDSPEQCRTPPTEEKLARLAMLQKIFSVASNAIVEPVDRPPNTPLMSGWRLPKQAIDRPIFIKGDAADYSCIRPDRLTIVYSDADLVRLRPFSPDFHAVDMPRIIFNRAGDRGFVRWSTGWSGGTYRLRLKGHIWRFEEISSWIS